MNHWLLRSLVKYTILLFVSISLIKCVTFYPVYYEPNGLNQDDQCYNQNSNAQNKVTPYNCNRYYQSGISRYNYPYFYFYNRPSYRNNYNSPNPFQRHHTHNPFHVPSGRFHNAGHPGKWRL
ncbi:hypothetical protein [Leptospira perolatii]|uniref:hypothetical protein n=1 Tax=Leptospira perolatii TaxID=2023191 RepID=UPI000F6418B1|nr:hypothetical protein [Leptospira perolatii]